MQEIVSNFNTKMQNSKALYVLFALKQPACVPPAVQAGFSGLHAFVRECVASGNLT